MFLLACLTSEGVAVVTFSLQRARFGPSVVQLRARANLNSNPGFGIGGVGCGVHGAWGLGLGFRVQDVMYRFHASKAGAVRLLHGLGFRAVSGVARARGLLTADWLPLFENSGIHGQGVE